jgi:hypothetical protein
MFGTTETFALAVEFTQVHSFVSLFIRDILLQSGWKVNTLISLKINNLATTLKNPVESGT